MRILICCLWLMFLPVAVNAAPAITCHCFTERRYDPNRPTLADPYFLATVQNSFFAALFGIDKKTVVIKKQGGTAADDLWIAYWAGARSAKAGEELLAARTKVKSWQEVLIPLKNSMKPVSEQFAAEVAANASAGRLARVIVDDVLIHHRLLGEQDLLALRREWAGNQELIITALVAAKTKRPALQIYQEVKKGKKSWGAFLNEASLPPSALQAEFAALLQK